MSRLDYCNSFPIALSTKLLNRLQYTQSSSARLLILIKRSSHINPILAQLHSLPVLTRIKFKVQLLTFKALHNLVPLYISDPLIQYTPSRFLRSSSHHLLSVPHSKLPILGGRSFCVMAPKLWNSFPPTLRACSSLPLFKSFLKTLLFHEHFTTTAYTSPTVYLCLICCCLFVCYMVLSVCIFLLNDLELSCCLPVSDCFVYLLLFMFILPVCIPL